MADQATSPDAPGTVLLEETQQDREHIILHPVPSDDPNEPLNWSTFRKSLNFTLACSFVCLTFVQLDNAYVAYEPYSEELGVTYDIYNESIAANYAGLAIGSIFFIPFVHRYGRRPLYLMSILVQLICCIWAAYMRTWGEMMANSFLGGLGGALSETIAMVTIGDLFFVHHHAMMNGIFLLAQSIGAFIGPVIMGYAVQNIGWRWMWGITAILIGVDLVVSLLCFEETKYVPYYNGQVVRTRHNIPTQDSTSKGSEAHLDLNPAETNASTASAGQYPRKTYRQRLAFSTPTDEPILRHIYQPIVILFTIPGVAYAAITYGTCLAWIATTGSALSYYTLLPPYNLTPDQVGLTNLGPFVGLLIGTIIFSPASDWSIVKLATRNKGVFEPEMRLWLSLVGAVLCFAGVLMFGLCLGKGLSLMSVLVGYAIFCVGYVIVADVSLTYVLDCYLNIIGDAIVAIVFCRNILAVIMLFVYTPWVNNLGVQNTFLMTAFFSLATTLPIPVLLLIYGKKLRISTAPRYRQLSGRQVTSRNPESL